MITHGLSRLSEFLGDRVIYRNLVCQDPNLPGYRELCLQLGLNPGQLPRKSEPAYGRVVALLLEKAQEHDHPGMSLRSLIFIGDTRLNDGSAFTNITHAGHWQGIAFIGSEKSQPAVIERDNSFELPLYNANHFSLLKDFPMLCRQHNIHIGADCAVVLDLDKTSLGARGRNDKAIDRARTRAAEDVVRSIARESFNEQLFKESYELFNQVSFHEFTTDNQDYLVYITLLVSMGVITGNELAEQVRSGFLRSFAAFANKIQALQPQLPTPLQEVQSEFYRSFQHGDPTPFKAFRRKEYLNTIQAMHTPAQIGEEMLLETICITQEVREFALMCKEAGCLLFGLSDKPDEASLPTVELAEAGWLPLHKAPMLAVSIP